MPGGGLMDTTQQWVDIIPPQAPLAAADPVLLLSAGVLLSALLAWLWFYYHRPRQIARRGLRQLAHALSTEALATKTVCFLLRQHLRKGLACERLQSVAWDEQNSADWQVYLERLRHYCFAATVPDTQEVAQAIREAQAWLRKKPGRAG